MLHGSIFEREMQKDPEDINCLDYKEYPLVDESEFIQMEYFLYRCGGKIYISSYVSHNSSGKNYVEIYVWEDILGEGVYKRFIICEGCRLNMEDERDFFHYINEAANGDSVITSEQEMQILYRAVNKYFPGWQYREYSQNDLAKALCHLYFASHRSGVREILYKSQLANIAYNIELIPGYNIIGTSPTTILDFGLPLKILKMFDQSTLIYKLYSETTINICRMVYEQYADYIGDNKISSAQWNYLEELCCNNGILRGRVFDRALYNKLENQTGEEIIYKYGRFLELKDKMPEIKVRLPRPENIEEEINGLVLAYEYKTGKTSENALIRERYKKMYYEYSNGKYVVTMPKDGFELCLEAINQRNCLMDYIEPHAVANTTILFLRKRKNPKKSFVTIEILNNEISQVYAKCNALPEASVYAFLEMYSKKMGLSYDPCSLIFSCLDESGEEIRNDLLRYTNELYERRRYASFLCEETEYYQITLLDLFPEIMNQEAYKIYN